MYVRAEVLWIASINNNDGLPWISYATHPATNQDGSKIAYVAAWKLALFDNKNNASSNIDNVDDSRNPISISPNSKYLVYLKWWYVHVYNLATSTYVWNIENMVSAEAANNNYYTDQGCKRWSKQNEYPVVSDDWLVIFTVWNNCIFLYSIPKNTIEYINAGMHTSIDQLTSRYIVYESIKNPWFLVYQDRYNDNAAVEFAQWTEPKVATNWIITYRNIDGNIAYYDIAQSLETVIAQGENHNISANGWYIVFTTNENLAKNDNSDHVGSDVYVYGIAEKEYALISIKWGVQAEDQMWDKATIAISADGAFVAMHGHDSSWFGQIWNDAQVFYAMNPFIQKNQPVTDDTYTTIQWESIVGNILENDLIKTDVKEIIIEKTPQHGEINMDYLKGEFTYIPSVDWCDQPTKSSYTYPTDTTPSEVGWKTITYFFALIDKNNYQTYFVNPDDHSSHIALTDEAKMREWIASHTELAENFTYTYDAKNQLWVFDYIGDPKNNNWIIYLGDEWRYFDKKSLDWKYIWEWSGSGPVSDYFTYYVIDNSGVKSTLATVNLHVTCLKESIGAQEDVYQWNINTTIGGIVSENDVLPQNGVKWFFVHQWPQYGTITSFNEENWTFEYAPNTDRCGVYWSWKWYIYPTSTTVDGIEIIALYGISNKESGNQYFMNPTRDQGVLLSDEIAIRTWIAGIPELASNIAYTYDAEQKIGIFDYIGTGKPRGWILTLSDSLQWNSYDKQLDGQYDNSLFEQWDYFTYYFADKETGNPYNLARVNISVACDSFIAVADRFVWDEDKDITRNVAENDTVPKNLKAFVVDNMPSYGSLLFDQKTGDFTYTPEQNYCTLDGEKDDFFSYYFVDENGNEFNKVDVQLHINCINDAPYATGGEVTIPLNIATGSVLWNLTGTDIESSGSLSYALVTTAYNSFAINSSWQFILIQSLPQIVDTYLLHVVVRDLWWAETTLSIVVRAIAPTTDWWKNSSSTGNINTWTNTTWTTTTWIIWYAAWWVSTPITTQTTTQSTSISHQNQHINTVDTSIISQSNSTSFPIFSFDTQSILNPSLEKMCTKIDVDVVLYEKWLWFSSYYKEALYFARLFDLTRYSDTLAYRPRDYVTREEAAKLFSQFATNILCRTPYIQYDASVFSDISTADPTLIPYIKQAYELGIFKGWEGKFRPTDILTKEETVAILMRLLTNQIADEQWDAWPVPYHNEALSAWILTNATTLTWSFTRSYIIQKLYAAYKDLPFTLKEVGYVMQKNK